MKAFLKDLFLVVLIPTILYGLFAQFALPKLLRHFHGPNTSERIQESFEQVARANAEMIFLGNSRIYRGVDPSAFDLPTYNFSHDNDSYNQLYYKLEYLISKDATPQTIVLGVDMFQFSFISDSRNYIYGKLLSKAYMEDYNKRLWIYDLIHFFERFDLDYLSKLSPKNEIAYQKNNGQFIQPGQNIEGSIVKRSANRLQLQVKYFEKILDKCKNLGIRAFLVLPPTQESELDSYTEKEIIEFNTFISNYRTLYDGYFDFSNDSSYTQSDFSDMTHLTPLAAARFSKQLNDSLIEFNGNRHQLP